MESIKIHDKTFVPYLKDNEIQEIVNEFEKFFKTTFPQPINAHLTFFIFSPFFHI